MDSAIMLSNLSHINQIVPNSNNSVNKCNLYHIETTILISILSLLINEFFKQGTHS